MKVLIAVDMQKDFIDGTLGSAEAEAIVAPLSEKLRNFNGKIILTREFDDPKTHISAQHVPF